MANDDDILTMSLKDFAKNIVKVEEHLAAIAALLPGLVGLTPDGRQSAARFRAGEADALRSVLDAADSQPPLFASLANQDSGVDPRAFETALLRDRLQRAAMLAKLANAFAPVTEGLADTVLHLGNLSKPVLLVAYNIAKIHAKVDGALANVIRPAMEFYAKITRASVASRFKGATSKE